jgi:uncharacterized membrane protein
MSLESNKTLGGIGAILIAIGSFFPVLSIIGIILVLIAMKGLAEYYNENTIFENALYGFICGLIGIVAAVIMFFSVIFTGAFRAAPSYTPSIAFPLVIIQFLVVLVVLFVFLLLQAVFYRKSFTILSEKSGEKTFETAGLLLLLGAILTIILVGFVLLLIAWILAAVGFFSIKTPTTQLPTTTPPSVPTAPVSVEKKYCRYCGTENKSDAIFCEKCGKKIAEE